MHARLLGGAPAPFAGNDLELARFFGVGPGEEWLKNAARAYGVDKFGEGIGMEAGTGLEGPRFERFDRQGAYGGSVTADGGRWRLAHQGGEATAEARVCHAQAATRRWRSSISSASFV